MKLKLRYEKVINEYLQLFCKKHELDFNDIDWIRNEVGSIFSTGDYYLDFLDIKFDIDNDIDSSKFFAWYDIALDLGMKDKPIINYQNFLNIKAK